MQKILILIIETDHGHGLPEEFVSTESLLLGTLLILGCSSLPGRWSSRLCKHPSNPSCQSIHNSILWHWHFTECESPNIASLLLYTPTRHLNYIISEHRKNFHILIVKLGKGLLIQYLVVKWLKVGANKMAQLVKRACCQTWLSLIIGLTGWSKRRDSWKLFSNLYIPSPIRT